jgi:hypothetical protein
VYKFCSNFLQQENNKNSQAMLSRQTIKTLVITRDLQNSRKNKNKNN